MMVSPAVVTDQMVCDIDGPVLDYADHKTLIFHHDFGLFIYNIGESRLDSTVNLKDRGPSPCRCRSPDRDSESDCRSAAHSPLNATPYSLGTTLIFHHDFGLFIYNIGENRLDSTVNLKELGCLDAKGQLNCEIFVTEPRGTLVHIASITGIRKKPAALCEGNFVVKNIV